MDGDFASTTLLLFLVLDPFGNIPIVAEALRQVPVQRWGWVILRECAVAYAVLLLFLFFGQYLMALLKVTRISLGIAGGIVLFLIALRMIFPMPGGIFGEPGGGEPLIVPIAIPSIAGPSSMAMVMLLASREPGRLWEWSASLSIAMLLTALPLLAASWLLAALGQRLVSALERLMGLLLGVLATEMLLQGVRDFILSLRPAAG